MAFTVLNEKVMFKITGIDMTQRFFVVRWCEDIKSFAFLTKLWAIDYDGKREVSSVGLFEYKLKNMHIFKNMDSAFLMYREKSKTVGDIIHIPTNW